MHALKAFVHIFLIAKAITLQSGIDILPNGPRTCISLDENLNKREIALSSTYNVAESRASHDDTKRG